MKLLNNSAGAETATERILVICVGEDVCVAQTEICSTRPRRGGGVRGDVQFNPRCRVGVSELSSSRLHTSVFFLVVSPLSVEKCLLKSGEGSGFVHLKAAGALMLRRAFAVRYTSKELCLEETPTLVCFVLTLKLEALHFLLGEYFGRRWTVEHGGGERMGAEVCSPESVLPSSPCSSKTLFNTLSLVNTISESSASYHYYNISVNKLYLRNFLCE